MAVLHSRSYREASPRGVECPLTTPNLRNSPAIRLNSHRLCRTADESPGVWQPHALTLRSLWCCITQLLTSLPPEHENGWSQAKKTIYKLLNDQRNISLHRE